jgi:hypothetical protein
MPHRKAIIHVSPVAFPTAHTKSTAKKQQQTPPNLSSTRNISLAEMNMFAQSRIVSNLIGETISHLIANKIPFKVPPIQ